MSNVRFVSDGFSTKVTAITTLCVSLVLLFAGCSKEAADPQVSPSSKPRVFVSNAPLKYFAERIGGDLIDVWYPIPTGGDPAYWNPGGDTVAEIQACDAIILNGATFEKWLPSATIPKQKTYDTMADLTNSLIIVEDATTHSHGPEGEHSHAGTAITTWLDLALAGEQANEVQKALASIAPDHAVTFESNATALKQEFAALDAELKTIGQSLQGKTLFGSHPIYQYLAHRYGLSIVSFHWEPDTLPDAHEWEHFEETQQATPGVAMLWEGDPLPESVAKLREFGVESIVFAPHGNVIEGTDFLTQMKANVAALAGIGR